MKTIYTGYFDTLDLGRSTKNRILDYVFDHAYEIKGGDEKTAIKVLAGIIKNNPTHLIVLDGTVRDKGLIPPELCTCQVILYTSTPHIRLEFKLSKKELDVLVIKFKLNPCQIKIQE